MRILVCGGRDYCDQEAIKKKLTELYERYPNSTLVHGGAPGADSWSGYIGGTLGFTVECHTAQWVKYGEAAGLCAESCAKWPQNLWTVFNSR